MPSAAIRPPPPLSLTRCWDRARWHLEGERASGGAPRLRDAYVHIVAALRFLARHGQLTPAGARALAAVAGARTALLDVHVRGAARGFLDRTYDRYLAACPDRRPPAVRVLEEAWQRYERRYDLGRRPVASPYHQLLLERTERRELGELLRAVARNRGLVEQVRSALPHAPAAARPLIEATLEAVGGDLDALARTTRDPVSLLRALAHVHRPDVLPAVARLVRRLGPTAERHRGAIATAVNQGRQDAVWAAIRPSDQRRIRGAVHRLFARDPHTALCALRTVGDATSQPYLDRPRPSADEGMVRKRGGGLEPAWEALRRQVRQRINASRA